jgi:hypothetical protein
MNRVFLKRNYDIIFTLLLMAAAVFATAFQAHGQSTTILSRKCPGPTPSPAVAKVEVTKTGDVAITPCSGKSITLNGESPETVINSINGETGASQTFATAANDTASWSSATGVHTLRLPITAVSGSSRTSYFPYFNAANTLAKSPLSWDGTTYTFQNTAGNSSFVFNFTPNASSGSFMVGKDTGTKNYFALDQSGGTASILSPALTLNTGTGTTSIGDTAGAGNGTKAVFTDSAGTVAITATGGLTVNGKTPQYTDQLLKSYLASTVTYNNTSTLANTALSVTVAASGIYDIELTVHSTGAVQPLKLDWGGTATTTNFIGDWYAYVINTPTSVDSLFSPTPGLDFDAVNQGAGTSVYTFKGTVEVNAAGTFLLRGAQSTANASNTTILRGSTLVLRKLN